MAQMSKQSVLFLCMDNSARSQIAEAFLRKYAGDLFDAHSAGVEPNDVNPLTLQVMNEVGMNIANQRSKGLEVYFGKTFFHYVITVCDDAEKNCPTVWLGIHTRMHWSFEDPAKFGGTKEERLTKFRETRNLIENKIRGWVARKTLHDSDLEKRIFSGNQLKGKDKNIVI
jgi:arsenate reductase (thioredoxin)